MAKMSKSEIYAQSKKAKTGEKIVCPSCEKTLVKRSYQQAFCCLKCKDRYWNSTPDRLERGILLGYIVPKEVVAKKTNDVSGIERLIRKKAFQLESAFDPEDRF